MISAVAQYEPSIAAAILSRAAFWLDDENNPAAAPVLPNEDGVRNAIISEVKKSIGAPENDIRPQTLERIGDFLDQETDSLLGITNVDAVLHRLAIEGEIPSDLYHVNIIENVKQVYQKNWDKVELTIRDAVRLAEQEQHFGTDADANKPKLISLFLKSYPDKFPFRSYKMLVAGQRSGLLLHVHQAWRIYADQISLEGAEDLVDVLRRFAEKYGVDFLFNGVKTKFVVNANLPTAQMNEIEILPQFGHDGRGRKIEKRPEVTISNFIMPSGQNTISSLTTAIDLDKYKETLSTHGW